MVWDLIAYGTSLNYLTALVVFTGTALMDALHAAYTRSITERKARSAATYGAFIYLFAGFAAIHFTSNPLYLIFVVAGSWIGTYVTLKFFHGKKESINNL